MKTINKKWGTEKIIVNCSEYCGKLLVVQPNHTCSIHFHKHKKETFYVVSGSLKLFLIDTETGGERINVLKRGEAITLEPLTPHRFESMYNTTCQFIEFATHHEDSDSYRVTRSK